MQKFLMIGLMVLVIPSFIFFYGWGEYSQSKRNGGMSEVATIDYPGTGKRTITQPDLDEAENMAKNQYASYMHFVGLPIAQSIPDGLVTTKENIQEAINLDILRHFADTHGITASRQDAAESIKSQTTAQQRMLIQQQLQRQGHDINYLLDSMRDSLLLQRVQATLASQVRVTNYEAWLQYKEQHEQLITDYARLNVHDFMSSITVSEKDLKKYFDGHKEDFRVPDQVKYRFIQVRKDDMKASITVTNDEITSYYATHKEAFRLPRKAQVRQIFLKKPNAAELHTTSPAEMTSRTEAVRKKAEGLYQRVAKGENFAQLADRFSEETTFPPREDANTTAPDAATTAGGYLGQVSQDIAKTWYGDAWTSTVFSMNAGSISHPVETPTGFAIVKLEKVSEGVIRPLNEVRSIIVEKIRDEKVEPLFDKMGKTLETAAEKYTGLNQLAKATSTTVEETGKINRKANFIPKIGILGDFAEPIQDLEKGGISDLLSDKQRHLLMEIVEEYPDHIPTLDEVRAKVTQAYKENKAREMARAAAEKIRKATESSAAFDKAAVDAGTTVTTSRPFTRVDARSIFGRVENFDDVSRGWKNGDSIIIPTGQGPNYMSYIVARLKKSIPPSKTDFSKNYAEIVSEIEAHKQRVVVQEFIRDQRRALKDRIHIDESYR